MYLAEIMQCTWLMYKLAVKLKMYITLKNIVIDVNDVTQLARDTSTGA